MASGVKTAESAICARVEAVWSSNIAIAWPQQDITPPDEESWLQVYVLWGDGFMETMEPTAGNRLYGVLQLDLYGPRGIGYGALLTLADTARDMVNRWSGSGIQMGAASPPNKVDDETYARLMIRTPFDVVDT